MNTTTPQRVLRMTMAAALAAGAATALAQERPVYRCPGNLYTDQYSAKEAAELGCKTLDGAPVTIVQSPVRRPPASAGGSGGEGATARPAGSSAAPAVRASGEMRVDPAQQRARDSDARRILESELAKEDERLAALRKDFNNGEPERRGDERNYARYQERVAEMKAAIARKEADIAALKRELAKLPAP
ncbi:hypothetical protein [Sphaerotilus sp.]|uniref:hypothetical protein n=1 Tax=Sphaerotilus sp. TaxID=2093942 RepID=UPI002ACEC301|nr:hypothetical protein [Sphaerotilus sp.]MDZ7857411.1 hypothetical protein [Sphaerotilus sp.]